MSQRVTFTGYYGQRNSGDDVFGLVSCWGARRFWGADPVLLQGERLESPGHSLPCAFRGPKHFRWEYSLLAAAYSFKPQRAVVFSGGSIFHSPLVPRSLQSAVHWGARLGRNPVGAIGVSLGPYRTALDRAAVEERLRGLAFLALRDERSYREALALDLDPAPVRAADLAWLLPEVEPAPARPRRGEPIGVVVCHYESRTGGDVAREDRREESLLQALEGLLARGFRGGLRLVVLNDHPTQGDQALTDAWAERLTRAGAEVEVRPYSNDPLAVWQSLRECRAVLSIRLHGAVLAAAGGVPALLAEYHPKCRDLLDDLGVPEAARIGDAELEAGEITRRLEACLDADPAALYPRLPELRERARRNFTEVPLARPA